MKKTGWGDRVEHMIKKTGLHKLAPEDCGCQERKEGINKLGDKINTFFKNGI